MKTKIKRLISSLLIMAFLVSAISVFASAADVVEGDNSSDITVLYNRGFDDGWDWNNGGQLAGEESATYGEEKQVIGVNRYISMTAISTAGPIYYQMWPTGMSTYSDYVLELDIRSDKFTKGGTSLLYTRLGSGDGHTDVTILRATKSGAFAFVFGGTEHIIAPTLPNEWMHISLIFKANQTDGTLTAKCYADDVFIAEGTVNKTGDIFPTLYRFQLASGGGANVDDNLCFDNIKLYGGTDKVTELDPENYGSLVDTSLPKTVPVDKNPAEQEKTDSDYINESLVMKVGTKRALKAGVCVNLFEGELAGQYGEPVVIDGVVYLPLAPVLEHMGFCYTVLENSVINVGIPKIDEQSGAITVTTLTMRVGMSEAIVGGEIIKLDDPVGVINTGLCYTDDSGDEIEASYTVIPMNAIETLFPGWYITYDDMGFIMLAEADELMYRDTALYTMVDLMKKFVYDNPEEQVLIDEISEKTNNFDHPYLYGNDDDFTFLRSIYNKEYLLDDGKANTAFLAECGLTLEYAELLNQLVTEYVNKAIQAYVLYIVPDITVDGNPNYFFTSSGGSYSTDYYTEELMHDKNGNLIYPYDDSVRGAGKPVFAPMFTTKGTSGRTWDFIEDDYVVVNAYYKTEPAKKNYIYDAATDSYIDVGEGNGIYDYVAYGFVDLKQPEKNYKYNEATSSYEKVASGKGTHDLVGTDADGNNVYAVLRTPLNNYSRFNRGRYNSWDLAYPIHNFMNFRTDSTDAETYLTLDPANPTLCRECKEDHFGYKHDSRLGFCADNMVDAQNLAFAYYMTGTLDYARLAYDLLDIVGNWQHWGPAHALNVAEGVGTYALAVDWLYDVVTEMSENGETNYKGEPMSISVLENHMWEHGLGEDYVMSVMKERTLYCRDDIDKPGLVANVYSYYVDDTSNWGNVCNANTAFAALYMLSRTETVTDNDPLVKTYKANGINIPTGDTFQWLAAEILSLKLWCLTYYAAYQYAPDGAYVEGPAYWNLGTGELMYMITGLYNITGHHYTILDAPGYDRTFTFAAYVESALQGNQFVCFSYNDSHVSGSMETGYYFTAALAMNQPGLIPLRIEHLKRGKERTYADVFLFKEAVNYAADEGGVELSFEYADKGIDIYTTRSSWDEDAPLFAGFVGGQSVTKHGHLDNGSWVYYNDGICWIQDLGMDDYSVYNDGDYAGAGDWNASSGQVTLRNRWRYYRLSAEGHNTFILTGHADTLPYGQNGANAVTPLIPVGENGEYFYSDENGSYAILDMDPAYKSLSGADYTKTAYRGMLLTGGRSTLVIQDEVEFRLAESVAWSAHIDVSGGYYTTGYQISGDRKAIYLTCENGTVCRMAIVAEDNEDLLGFEVRKTDPLAGKTEGVYLLDATFPYNSHLQLGGAEQYDRTTVRNIIIQPKNSDGTEAKIYKFNVAVVLETFGSMAEAQNAPIGYEYTPMSEWQTYEAGKYSDNFVSDEEFVQTRLEPTLADFTNVIIPNATDLSLLLDFGTKVQDIDNIYSILTDSCWAINGLKHTAAYSGSNEEAANTIYSIAALYDEYIAPINVRMDYAMALADCLT